MAWLDSDDEKILHIKQGSTWVPYHRSPLAVPDYTIPRGSKGWATYQKLRALGWQLVSSDSAELAVQAP